MTCRTAINQSRAALARPASSSSKGDADLPRGSDRVGWPSLPVTPAALVSVPDAATPQERRSRAGEGTSAPSPVFSDLLVIMGAWDAPDRHAPSETDGAA
jgi:hypothetical protein